MNKPAPIVLAVDTSDLDVAKQWVSATDGVISVVKLGLEFYTTLGNDGIRAIADSCSTDIFLDLKLHDIPHTVAGAARAVSMLRPKFLTCMQQEEVRWFRQLQMQCLPLTLLV